MKTAILAAALILSLAACSKEDKKVTNSGGITENACARSTVGANAIGTCQIRLLSPAACEEIDLSDDFKVVEFKWTTDGTDCPSDENGRFSGFVGHVGGNPITQNADETLSNVNSFNLLNGDLVGRGGGTARLRARDLQGLTSTDGTFEWTIRSGLQAGPASQVVKIKR